ncbi:hypothetical protein EDM59_23815 [Brevibacillus nitrificans]|uniref:Xylose isomerase-like TIM barrel domain-containing protein n=1 Tax=Brevibacillus nitrificans TaxID=651560 RepID=A0A3M8CZP9_9BACL|nr:hypothetical protein EDM59_23815 [Brevibacillus nitrificans]
MQELSRIQNTYEIPIICEPKLGIGRSTKGIEYLDAFPVEIGEKYSLKLCIVHLHNVAYEDDQYIWIPVHPSHENNGVQYKIAHVMRFLAQCEGVQFIFEHTPHSNPSRPFVQQGYTWVRSLIMSK